jgi:hypothetical protein
MDRIRLARRLGAIVGFVVCATGALVSIALASASGSVDLNPFKPFLQGDAIWLVYAVCVLGVPTATALGFIFGSTIAGARRRDAVALVLLIASIAIPMGALSSAAVVFADYGLPHTLADPTEFGSSLIPAVLAAVLIFGPIAWPITVVVTAVWAALLRRTYRRLDPFAST